MNILIDMPVFEPLLEKLKAVQGLNIRLVEPPEEKSRSLPEEMIKDCDALCCTFPPENHHLMKKLQMIQISSAGYTQLLGQGFKQRKVRTCNALGVFDVPIAEWNMAMMVNLARDMRTMMQNQTEQIWDRSARFQHEIRGSVVGIWGYGGIGRETARLAKAFGLTVHVLTKSGVNERKNTFSVDGTGDPEGILPDKVFVIDEKESFLKGLDFLVIAMPQTESNEGIIGEEELSLLKNTTFLLNPARGPLVQEKALINALQTGQIAGTALDTHYYYPMPKDHPLWSMPNVLFTPHISGSSASPKFLERVWTIFVENIIRLKSGKPLLNELTENL